MVTYGGAMNQSLAPALPLKDAEVINVCLKWKMRFALKAVYGKLPYPVSILCIRQTIRRKR